MIADEKPAASLVDAEPEKRYYSFTTRGHPSSPGPIFVRVKAETVSSWPRDSAALEISLVISAGL
jgi:hypothetical protein